MRNTLLLIAVTILLQSCAKKRSEVQISSTIICNSYLIDNALTLWKKKIDNEPYIDNLIKHSNRLLKILGGFYRGESHPKQNSNLIQPTFYYGNGRLNGDIDVILEEERDKSIVKEDSIVLRKILTITELKSNVKYIVRMDFLFRKFTYKSHDVTLLEKIIFDHPKLQNEFIGMPIAKYTYDIDVKKIVIINQIQIIIPIHLTGVKKGSSANIPLAINLEDVQVLSDKSVLLTRQDKELEIFTRMQLENTNWSAFKEKVAISLE